MTESGGKILDIHNGQVFDPSSFPPVCMDDFRKIIIEEVHQGGRIVALFGAPGPDMDIRLYCITASDAMGRLRIICTDVRSSYPALTPDCPQAHWFEREICEQWHLVPEGHPWLKPIRFQPARRPGAGTPVIGDTDFFRLEGQEAHEVAVGPVHAGVIEPGHFRFQCHGETVYHLEISLGYQHRGIERALVGGPRIDTPFQMETLAGDTTIGHMTSYCRMIEHFCEAQVPARGQAIRGIAAELERMANHIGDLGAMAGDVGFLPTMSYCGRIRGDVLNMTALICGNRFGRGLIVPGGTAWDIEPSMIKELLDRLKTVEQDATSAVELMFNTPSVLARFENIGVVNRETAEAIGLVGPAARASGLVRDVRNNFAYGIYRYFAVSTFTWHTGDCFARAYIRWVEVLESIRFIRTLLQSFPAGAIRLPLEVNLPEEKCTVILGDGWRGEICHMAVTDTQGKFAFYKVVDPSFHNWFGLSMAMRNQQVSDFPLCNKSFNLSYCGHDL